MNEVWHPVVGYEGLYEVSDQGKVRSVTRRTWNPRGSGCWMQLTGKLLKQHPRKRLGHLTVSLHKNHRQKTLLVHRLVTAAFLGPVPTGQEVRHGPAGVKCNALSNLCYGTAVQNAADKLRDGTDNRGTKHYRVKHLDESAVLAIFNAPKYRGCNSDLACEYGTTIPTVKKIRQGRSWSWLTGAG